MGKRNWHLVVTVSFVLCGRADCLVSNAPADENHSRPSGITKKDLNEDDLKFLVSHMPTVLRRGISDEELSKELETVACVFDYRGGPIKLWMEIEETGQETLGPKFPKKADDWHFNSAEGHVCVAFRRNLSERARKVALKAGKKATTESASIVLMFHSSKRDQKEAKDNSHTSETSETGPLWFGWKKYKLETEYPEADAKKGESLALFVVKAEETTEGVKEHRKVKLTLKAIFGN